MSVSTDMTLAQCVDALADARGHHTKFISAEAEAVLAVLKEFERKVVYKRIRRRAMGYPARMKKPAQRVLLLDVPCVPRKMWPRILQVILHREMMRALRVASGQTVEVATDHNQWETGAWASEAILTTGRR